MTMMSDISSLPTNVTEKCVEILEVQNGFVATVSYESDIDGYRTQKYIFVNWNEMVDELQKWFIGGAVNDNA